MGVLVRDGLYQRTKEPDCGKTGPEKRCTKEEQEFLKLREQLKTAKRENMRKICGFLPGYPLGENKLADDSFGSFFGPSRPAIAQRVIQNSKDIKKLLNIQNLTKKASNSHGRVKKTRLTESNTKAWKIRESRDYSFLFAEGAEVPIYPEKGQSTAGQSDQPAASGKQSTNSVTVACKPQHSFRLREGLPTKRLSLASTNPRMQLEAMSESGIAKKHVVQGSFDAKRPTCTVEKTCGKNSIPANHGAAVLKANTLMRQQLEEKKQDDQAGKKMAKLTQNQIVCSLNHNVPDKRKVVMSKSLAATKKLLKQRKEYHSRLKASSSKSYVTIQYPGWEKIRIDNASLIQREKHPVPKHRAREAHQTSLLRSQPEAKEQLTQEKKFPGPVMWKMKTNQIQSSSLNQVPVSHRAPLSKSHLATKQPKEHEISGQKPVKAKIKCPGQVLSDEENDYEDADQKITARVSAIIQGLFRRGRNSEEYTQRDYSDDECMVANFDQLEKEERKSARIGKKEDAIELKRIQREDKEDRLRKVKKQKLEQN